MSITIIKPGILTTIQDGGRWGFQHLGINPGGAMDIRAMQIANCLVLNNVHEASLEFYFPAPVIQFNQPAFIALSGADFGASVNETAIPINQPVYVPANAILRFNAKKKGQVGYLAVQTGFALHDWLNSYSTHLKVKAGGYEGRALMANDELYINNNRHFSESNQETTVLPWKADTESFYTSNPFHFIPGHEFDRLSEQARRIFTTESFLIQPHSDRMGYHLKGPELSLYEQKAMISSAVTAGTIQLLPNGQCILLMADHQTTGGYPNIGHVIGADLPGLAQKATGQALHFTPIDIVTAENLWVMQEQHLQQLMNACKLQLDAYHRH